MQQYDVVIIGAGLGGLLCAAMLAKEGMHVAVIEQNKQIGGCLQTFSFDKKVFDSCVHYIGAMEDGQTQKRIFDYVGISSELNLKRLDQDGFDKIIFNRDDHEYPIAQGLSNFRNQLEPYFPNAIDALHKYTKALEFTGSCFPLYNLRNGSLEEKNIVSSWEIDKTMDRIVSNEKLKNVLCGNSLLYAGEKGVTPFYVHSLVSKSYIDSAYKCQGGSSQISKLLWKKLHENGGVIFRNEKVIRAVEQNNQLEYVETESGQRFYGKQFICNIHPAVFLNLLQTDKIKPAYKNRIQNARNTASAWMINVVLKPATTAHRNHNIYWHNHDDIFKPITDRNKNTIDNYALYFTEDKHNRGYAESVAILLFGDITDTETWSTTNNRTAQPTYRGKDYEEYKNYKAQKIFDTVSIRFPDIIKNVSSYSVASPLTFRDYMGTTDGSMYGIITDVNYPEATRIPIRTKLSNLYYTGQNINLHGVLGVSITAVATCGHLIGLDYLLNKM